MGANPVNNNKKVNPSAFNNIKSGAKRSEMKTNIQKSIFDKIDKNRDGIISSQEGVAIKEFKGRSSGDEYLRIRYLKDGNFLVTDKNGKLHVMKKDGTVLNGIPQQYMNEVYPQGNQQTQYNVSKQKVRTLSILDALGDLATKKFNEQMEKDGWAADAADGISKLWNNSLGEKIGINTGNTASQVRKDLKAYEQNMKRLNDAAQKGEAEFNAEFKRIFGVDYDQNAIDAFINKKTKANWHKAFGSKPDIATRVIDYNKSQDTGAEAVKTTAKVAGTIAVGVATGGTGFVALGAAAAGAAVVSAAVEYTDDVKVTQAVTKGKVERRGKKSNGEILKGAAIDGGLALVGGATAKVASTVVSKAGMEGVKKVAAEIGISTLGDAVTGAGVEYLETGEVTIEGTITNTVMSLGGSVAVEAAPAVARALKGSKNKSQVSSTTNTQTVQKPEIEVQQTKVEAPQTKVEAVQTKVETVQTKVETPQTKVEAAQTKVETPQTKVETAQTKVETPQTKVEAAQTKVEITQQKIPDNLLKNADLSDENVQNELLNLLNKEFPSTKNAPGRLQVLRKMQTLVNDPAYELMSEESKQIAKLAILRSNPRIDPRSILDDINISTDARKRLLDIETCLKDDNINSVAALYHDGDLETMISVARASGVEESTIIEMKSINQRAEDNGCLLVNQSRIRSENIPVQEITKDGKTYKIKIIDCTDPATFTRPELFGLEPGTTADNMRVTVHMNDDINSNPRMTLGRMRSSDNLNLSASITDGKNGLYGDQQVGVFMDYDMGSVSYASNYAAGTGFCKDNKAFAESRLKLDQTSTGTFIRDRFIENINKEGLDITLDDYMAFSKQFQTKTVTLSDIDGISINGMVDINGKKVSAESIKRALAQSTDDLIGVSYEMRGKMVTNGFNEINIYHPEIKGVYIRANSENDTIESILSTQLLDYIQSKNIPIIFQRSVI